MRKLVYSKPSIKNINPEKIEEEYKAFIDSGGGRPSYTLHKEDLEEIHMGFGDDLFYSFITTVDLYLDSEGMRYIEVFEKTYEIPEEKDKEEIKADNIIERLEKEYHNFRHSRDPRRAGTQPKYLILSRDLYIELQKEVENTYKVNSKKSKRPHLNQIEYEIINDMKYRGIPICIYESHKKKNILDFV